MIIHKLAPGLALAALLTLAAAPGAASASVTYHFAEATGVGNVSSGLFGDGVNTPRINNPFTFDFTVANVLAANSTYSFSAPGLGTGTNGNVLDFKFSDGTPLSTFSLANLPATHTFRGGPAASDEVSIGVNTDASGAIFAFAITIDARSTVNPDEILFFQLQKVTTPGSLTGINLTAYDYGGGGTYRFVGGEDRCVQSCGGTWSVLPAASAAVPEPMAWSLMILGFGGVGAMLRRRRAAAFIAA